MKSFKVLVALVILYCVPVISSDKPYSPDKEKPFRAGRVLRIGAAGFATLWTLGSTGICLWQSSKGIADAATGNTEMVDGMIRGNNSGTYLRFIPGLLGVGAFTGFLSYKSARSFWNQVKGLNRPYTIADRKKDNATFIGLGALALAGLKFWPKKD